MEIVREETSTPFSLSGSTEKLRRKVRAATAALFDACGAFEFVAISYLGFSGLLVALFWRNLPRAGRLLFAHGGAIAFVIGLVMVTRRVTNSVSRKGWAQRIFLWLRDWYPQMLFLFCFEELGTLVHLVRRGWSDNWFLQFDHWLIGGSPTVWFAQHSRPLLTDFMQMSYLSYFFFLTILAIVLHRHGADQAVSAQSHQFAFWAVMTSSMAAYAIGYVISIFIPVESPYFSLASLHLPPLHGGPFTKVSDLIEHFGRVHGGAFPSEHVAGSFVALLGAWRYRRRLFWSFLPFFACMCVSTVYVRNHYVADVIAGFATGGIGFWLGQRAIRWKKTVAKRRQALALETRGAPPKFRMGLLENAPDAEQFFFAPGAPDNLQSDGETLLRPTAGQ